MDEDSRTFLPPEARLVFLSAGGEWADPGFLRALRGELRWPLVLELARREGATPVLFRRLRKLDVPDLPEEVLSALQRLAEVQEFRMALLEDRLTSFLQALEEKGIPAILLKGAAVAQSRQGGFRERPMGDLDLLVPGSWARTVHDLALEAGWALPTRALSEDMYEDLHHLLPLDAADGLGFGLEIHTDLFPDWSPFRFPTQDVWNDAERIATPGLTEGVLVPSLQHQFLHTCMHFAWSHCFGRGAWRMIRDLDLLLSDPRFDSEAVLRKARNARAETCVYWTLSVVEILTGRMLPEGLLEGLGVTPSRFARLPLLRHLAREAQGDRGIPGTRRLRRALWAMAIRPGRSGHGGSRPWTGADRWAAVMDPFGLDRADENRFAARLGGFFRYIAYVLGPSGAE